jgi:hypothetical protein
MKRILSLGLALIVVSAGLLSLSACSSSSGEEAKEPTTVPAVYTESAVTVEKSSEEVLKYFNTILNNVKAEKPRMYYRFEKNVPNDSLKVTKAGQEEADVDSSLSAINDAAKAVKDLMLENIKENSGELAFGADNTDVLLVQGESFASKLTADDVKYATMTEVGDKYFITIEFDDITEEAAKEVLSKAFNLRDKADILNSEEFAKTKAYLELKDYSVVYSGCRIKATVNRLTNQIETVEYFKVANVTASATGKGTFEAHGDLSILFTLEDKSYYEMYWENEDPTSPLETTTAAPVVEATMTETAAAAQ